MKGTEKIIAHIQADAAAQADAILAQAEQQCAEIREGYERKAKDAYAEKIRAGVKANQDRLESVERLARMEGRKSVLALKQDMVSKSFDLAVDKLVNLPEEQYDLLLKKVNIDIKKELCKLFTLTDSNNHQSDNIDFNHNFSIFRFRYNVIMLLRYNVITPLKPALSRGNS